MTMKQKKEWGSVTALQKFFFFSERKYTNITDPLTFPSLGETNSGRCECCLSWRGEGEGDSARSEMMVASSVKLRLRGGGVLWYDSLLLPRYDRVDSPPAYCLVIWWMAFGPARCMACMSVNKSRTTFSRGRRFNDLGGARSGRVSPLY